MITEEVEVEIEKWMSMPEVELFKCLKLIPTCGGLCVPSAHVYVEHFCYGSGNYRDLPTKGNHYPTQ